MSQDWINMVVVGASFLLYIGIAVWARAGSTKEFYVAGGGVHPVTNGMETAADWLSAASFISMAGLIDSGGYATSVYLMGWTGGYVLLALQSGRASCRGRVCSNGWIVVVGVYLKKKKKRE